MYKNVCLPSSAEPEVKEFFQIAHQNMTRLKYQSVVWGVSRTASRCLMGLGGGSVGYGIRNFETTMGKISVAVGGASLLVAWGLSCIENSMEDKVADTLLKCREDYEEFDSLACISSNHPVDAYSKGWMNVARDCIGAAALSTSSWYLFNQPSLGEKIFGGVMLLGGLFAAGTAAVDIINTRRAVRAIKGAVKEYLKENNLNPS